MINMFNASRYADMISMMAATEVGRKSKLLDRLVVGLVLQDPSIFYETKEYPDSVWIFNGQYGVMYQGFSRWAYRKYVKNIRKWVRFPGSFSDEIVRNVFARLLQLKEVADRKAKGVDSEKILRGLKTFGLGPADVSKPLVLSVLKEEVGKYQVAGDGGDFFSYSRSQWIRTICRKYWISDEEIEDWAMRRMALDICMVLDDCGQINSIVEDWLDGWFLNRKFDFGLAYNSILRTIADQKLMERKEIYLAIKKILENR